jgi:transposase
MLPPMYIKRVRKSNRNSSKVYEYLHLVENVRTENGPRQRLILNLGAVAVAPEQYKELANCIEALLTGQSQLFSPDPQVEKHARKAADKIQAKHGTEPINDKAEAPSGIDQNRYQAVDVASMQASQLRSLGPEYVCHNIWNELKFNELLLSQGISEHVLPLLQALVVGRLVSPGSEVHTWNWAEQQSAIYELTGPALRPSLSSLYRAGDRLFDCKDALERHLSYREKDLFSLPERLCLFDLTNTYFEGQASANTKAKRGRSKEKRSDCKLLTLALVVDEQGFAKYSQLYPGNQAECKTLKEIIESLVQLRPNLARDRTVIIDAGIATEENIAFLKENRFHYIVVKRGKAEFTPDDTNAMQVIRQNEQYTLEVKRRQVENETLLLCRSTGRRGKDQGIRGRQEALFLERLQYYHDGLDKKGHTKAYPKVIEMVGRLREKYPRASKLYEVEVVAEEKPGKTVKAKAVEWKKRSQYDASCKFEGCYVLRTDRMELTDREIWETYVMLTRVESAFRSMKSSLGLRPNFHQNEERADAHMFISVLAYHVLHVIEHKLHQCGDHRTWATIREILSTHQRLTIEYNVKEHGKVCRNHLRLCSKAESEHKQIYQRLGLKEIPLPRKILVAK